MLTATLAATSLALAAVGGEARTPSPAIPNLTTSRISVHALKTLDGYRTLTLAAAPVGRRIAVALEDRTVRVLDSSTGAVLMNLKGHPRDVTAIAWNPTGTMIATGDDSARIWLWDAKTGKRTLEMSRKAGISHTRAIQDLCFSPSGSQLISVGKDDVAKVWTTSGTLVKTILGSGANFFGVGFSPSGGLFLGTLAEGVRIYMPKTFGLSMALRVPGGQGANDIAINRAGTTVLSAGRDGIVSFWDVRSRKLIAGEPGHGDWVMRSVFSQDGRLAATSGNDGKVVLWDVTSHKVISILENQSTLGAPLAFSGDGRYLVTTNVFDLVQINEITGLTPPSKPPVVSKKKRK